MKGWMDKNLILKITDEQPIVKQGAWNSRNERFIGLKVFKVNHF